MPILAVPAVFMVSGIAGGLASANLAVDRVTVTSSAAVCGLIGLFTFLMCSIEMPVLVTAWVCCIPNVQHCCIYLCPCSLSVCCKRLSAVSVALLLQSCMYVLQGAVGSAITLGWCECRGSRDGYCTRGLRDH